MNVLLWHVHGPWTASFVRGRHSYLLPTTPLRDDDGLGFGGYDWSATARQVPAADLRHEDVDVVVLQRPHERYLARDWLGRDDVPMIYVEHGAPTGDVPDTRHPMADEPGITIVHVTRFNRLMWDNGQAHTVIIEPGVADPGARCTGEIPHAAAVVDEPIKRGRATGTDLLPGFTEAAPLDVFGLRTDGLAKYLGVPGDRLTSTDLPPAQLHEELAKRRVYLHPARWTSPGLPLLEAMHLAMPVVALDTAGVREVVPPEAGVISTDPAELRRALADMIADPGRAREAGLAAREAALRRYGLQRFLDDWDRLLGEAAVRP
ncbi:glycosyltransferase [Actinomadura hibisca]|uniref:glycosyltransferase n=1 Tax=Actinomadura hibisca TaxID=68565 RepID=UPI000829C5C5|nr:glycosyltransferase [Actinomadura hibisca]